MPVYRTYRSDDKKKNAEEERQRKEITLKLYQQKYVDIMKQVRHFGFC